MAQGAGKARGVGTGGKKGQSAGSQRKKAGTTRKGKMDVAPKDRAGIAARVQNKKLSSNINKSIERQMVDAASAGKLTIMANKGGDKIEPGAGKANAKGKK